MKAVVKNEVTQITKSSIDWQGIKRYTEKTVPANSEVTVVKIFNTWSLVHYQNFRKYAFAVNNSELNFIFKRKQT